MEGETKQTHRGTSDKVPAFGHIIVELDELGFGEVVCSQEGITSRGRSRFIESARNSPL